MCIRDSLGAIAVIPANESLGSVKKYCDTNLVIESGVILFDTIEDLPRNFDQKYKHLLDNEAFVTFEKGVGIRRSHYNLLVNTNSIQKVINLKSRTRFSCNLKPVSSAWAVLKAILPIYCGCIFDIQNPEKALLKIGDRISFNPISETEFERWHQA